MELQSFSVLQPKVGGILLPSSSWFFSSPPTPKCPSTLSQFQTQNFHWLQALCVCKSPVLHHVCLFLLRFHFPLFHSYREAPQSPVSIISYCICSLFSTLPDLSYSKILFYHPSFHKGSLSPFCKYFKALKNEPCIRLCMLLNILLNMLLVIFENLLELNPSKKSAIIVGDSTLIKATGLSPAAWAGLDKLHLEITNKSAKSFTFYEQEWRGIQLPKACRWKAAAPDTFPFLFPCSLWHLMSTHRSTSRAGPATLRREMLKLGWGVGEGGQGLEAHGMSTARASFCQPGAIGGGGMAERSIRPPRQGCEASSEEGRMFKHCPRKQQGCSPARGFANRRHFLHPRLPVLAEECHCSPSLRSREAPQEEQGWTRTWCPGALQLLSLRAAALIPTGALKDHPHPPVTTCSRRGRHPSCCTFNTRDSAFYQHYCYPRVK